MQTKAKNLRELSTVDLSKKLEELQEKMRAHKFKMEGAKSKNVKEVKEIRRDIARVLTVIATNIKK